MTQKFVPLDDAQAIVKKLEAENKRLRAQLQETWSLSISWKEKHDHLLGFIQKRPAMLKELIEQDRALEQSALVVDPQL